MKRTNIFILLLGTVISKEYFGAWLYFISVPVSLSMTIIGLAVLYFGSSYAIYDRF
ncbi:hypothetical protein [Cytobacillus horneckiae]|uniref:hypothetical protein n=1 Tax=Cytobacillus horneckiae TaxID=549687 RepID=UPI000A84903B|nr:hypothetical protein [Cytobacillus horneckiae]MEC1155425.1 hypothetical protein [Cytobacillus horneckiae]MED2936523.1 hypothetical protein [Cytobacillus horneckiae]